MEIGTKANVINRIRAEFGTGHPSGNPVPLESGKQPVMLVNNMDKPKINKRDWQPVSARIPPDLRTRLLEKHSKEGDISKLIHVLLQKYIEGRIVGVRIEQSNQ